MAVRKEKREKISAQCLAEIEFCRQKKQQKYNSWHRNEDLYYGRKINWDGARANVNLNEMQSFVNTFLSKINTPFNYTFQKGEEADLQAAKVVNSLKERDRKLGQWDWKALLGRTQLTIYGREIYEYHADSLGKQYNSYLTNVDVYNFLIDPSCGWDDLEKAFFLWRGGILKTRKQIEDGVRAKIYIPEEAKLLLSSDWNTENTPEENEAKNRYINILTGDKNIQQKGVWKLYEWYTTFEGERYYNLIGSNGELLRCEILTDMFKSGEYPYFTASAFPDLTEFWTNSPVDGVREPIVAKSVSIGQMIDNSEAINRPMRAFKVGSVKNPALLKFRPDGLVAVEWAFDVQRDIQNFPTIPITTAIQVYDKLDVIISTQSWVTNGARGNASEDKVGIYEGNQQSAADRFALIRESEAQAQQKFARLYLNWLKEHMTGKIAVEMIGLDGVEYKEVTKRDIATNKEFDIVVTAAWSEQSMELVKKRDKLVFIQNNKMNPIFNPQVMAEMEANIVGFDTDEVKQMMEKDYGNAELMAECARDIQDMLGGKRISPNEAANTAYMQKLLDFMQDQKENLKDDIFGNMVIYMEQLQPIVMRNMARKLNEERINSGLLSLGWQTMEWQAPMEQSQETQLANPWEQLQY